MTLHTLLDDYKTSTLDWEGLMLGTITLAKSNSKSLGAVYTPKRIVEALIKGAKPTRDDVIWEPACGHGAFIIPLLETIRGDWDAPTLLAWINTHLYGTDINPHTISDLKSILIAWFEKTYQTSLAPEDFTTFLHADGLLWTPPQPITLIIGNPPYIRFQNLPDETRTFLQQTYTSCAKGNVDIYYAFLERALHLSERTAYIVPNAFLSTQSGAPLRALLAPRLDHLHNFGDEKVFPGVGTYTALVFLNTREKAQNRITSQNAPSPSSLAPTIRPKTIRTIQGPIATLCDKAYLLVKTETGFESPLTGLPIEPELVRPLLKLSTLHRHSLDAWHNFILYPYVQEKPIDESLLKTRYPLAYAHLLAVKHLLDARDKGKTSDYPTWYAYGRGQGLTPLEGKTALIVPAMISQDTKPQLVDLTPLASYQAPIIVSGFAIPNPTPQDVNAFTHPDFLTYVAQTIPPKPGKNFPYYPLPSWIVKSYSPQ